VGAVPLTALAVVALFGGLTLSGLRTSAHLLRWTAAAKLAIVVVLLAFAVRAATTIGVTAQGGSGIPLGPGGLAASAIAAFFAFGGWWDLGRMSEEVTTPARTLPRALLGGVAVVTVLYMLLTVAFMLVVPATDLDSDEALVSMVGVVLFGEAAGRLLAVMVVVAVAGSLAAVLLSAPRVYLAMARDGIFPERLVRYDPARGTAAGATLIQVAVAAALVLLGTFDQILAYFVPGAVFFLGLSAAALIRLPRPAPEAVVFRVPGHPMPLLLFLTLITGMLLLFAVGQPVQTLAGALVVAAGIPVSFLVTRHRPR
jgi:basic amino acid/polyamine antiporter, APA family